MAAPPVLLAVIPCAAIARDPYSLRYTIAGTLQMVPVAQFPAVLPEVAVFVAITAVRSPTRVGVQLIDPDGEELGRLEWDAPGGDPLYVLDFAGRFGQVRAEKPGYYTTRATADGDMLGEWRFIVDIPGRRP